MYDDKAIMLCNVYVLEFQCNVVIHNIGIQEYYPVPDSNTFTETRDDKQDSAIFFLNNNYCIAPTGGYTRFKYYFLTRIHEYVKETDV